jgi:hypothetical protein
MNIDTLKTKTTKIVTHIVNNTIGDFNHKWFVTVFGIFTLIIVGLILLFDCPTNTQMMLLRPAFAIGITGLFASISSSFKIRTMDLKWPLVFGLFMFLYLVNPASTISRNQCDGNNYINGKIFLGQTHLNGAKVSLPLQDFQTISNGSGEFVLQWVDQESSDSLLIQIESKSIDTSIYWRINNSPLVVFLPDTLVPISKSIIESLFDNQKQQLDRKMKGKYLQWQLEKNVSISQLIEYYMPFERKQANYRNEFLYQGIEKELRFRKNLLKAGISQVEPLGPFERHHFDSCSIYILKYQDFPNYELEYLMVNKETVEYQINKPQMLSENHYSASVSYKNNINCVKVNLQCSKATDGYKVRSMEFYGFLPVEEYELKFRNGNWNAKLIQ